MPKGITNNKTTRRGRKKGGGTWARDVFQAELDEVIDELRELRKCDSAKTRLSAVTLWLAYGLGKPTEVVEHKVSEELLPPILEEMAKAAGGAVSK